MGSLKEVRNRINSVKSTQQITKAMKMVAAAKLKRAQNSIIQLRPYAEKLDDIIANVSATLDTSTENPYAEQREVKKVAIIAITSDRGLCGAFNSNINKGVQNFIDKKFADQFAEGNVDIIPIGNKALEYFRRREYPMVKDYSTLFTELSFDKVKEAAEFTMNSFLEEKYDQVFLVYNEFKNVATQVVRKEQFLPMERIVDDKQKTLDTDYIFEPSKKEILEDLIPNALKIKFYKAILESNASEHGARMTAMDKATDNAGDLLKELKLTYNRTRQAAITTEILEIVGGANALDG